jgi:hypothetical protein
LIRLAYTKCERRGQRRKATLIERYGAAANMVAEDGAADRPADEAGDGRLPYR